MNLKDSARAAIKAYVADSMPGPNTVFYSIGEEDVDHIVSSVMSWAEYDIKEQHEFYNEANEE